jgi:alginate production protein
MSFKRLRRLAAVALVPLIGAPDVLADPDIEEAGWTSGAAGGNPYIESSVPNLDYLSADLALSVKDRPNAKSERSFDLDASPPTTHDLGHGFSFGGKLEGQIDLERNFDLDNSKDDNGAFIEPELTLALSYDPVEDFGAFLEVNLSREYVDRQSDDSGWEDTVLSIKRAYLTWRDIVPGLALRVGRQRFDDEREWLYDEDLDAIRVFYFFDKYGIEGSTSREELVASDVLNGSDEDEINNYGLTAMSSFGKKSTAAAYVFYRDDLSAKPEDLLFLGVRTKGRIASRWDYWLEAAHVRGSKIQKSGKRTISGFGADVGSTYELEAPFEPSLTLGAAFGTGDSGDGKDNAFRQSGFQGNSDRFNGVASFKYYGETLDPELSNMIIVTAGAGVKPTKQSSIDLVYHRYWQHRKSDDLRDVSIDADPNGDSRDLGHGVDIVIGFREIENFDVEFVAGTFIPGSAFGSGSDPAYSVGFEFQFKF